MFETQNETERSEIRAGYLKLLEEANKPLNEISTKELTECVDKANVLHKSVKKPREAALDSRFVHLWSTVGRQKIQALDTSFDPVEFAQKLVTYMKRGKICTEGNIEAAISDENWIHLGETFFHGFKRSPAFHYMYGCLQSEPVEIKNKQKRRTIKDKFLEKAVVPEKINIDATSLQLEKTTEQVERILSILQFIYKKEKHPISYFEFVINPDSYCATVENIFHTSFLIKDEAALLYLDDDDLPVIQPVNKKSSDNSKTSHLIVSISMDEWSDLIQLFKIKKCVIPIRQ